MLFDRSETSENLLFVEKKRKEKNQWNGSIGNKLAFYVFRNLATKFANKEDESFFFARNVVFQTLFDAHA